MNYIIRINLLLLIINYSFPGYSQSIKIRVDNPFPRQYQSFEIKFEPPSYDESVLYILGKPYIMNNLDSKFRGISVSPKDTGTFQIGPFEIATENGKQKTDSATIRVLPELPPIEGIYISSYVFDNHPRLVIEQVYISKMKPGQFGFETNLVEFQISNRGLMAFEKISIENPLTIYRKNSELGQYNYSLKSYIILNSKGKKYEILKTDFKNLPEDFEMPLIFIE